MEYTWKERRKPSVWKGVIAGAVGGLVAYPCIVLLPILSRAFSRPAQNAILSSSEEAQCLDR